jgi:hypothetical protein
MSASPLVGFMSPLKIESVVVFPAPFTPLHEKQNARQSGAWVSLGNGRWVLRIKLLTEIQSIVLVECQGRGF